jgi:endonuclease G, mitochondrial
MAIPNKVLEQTIDRYKDRRIKRNENIKMMEEGRLLEIDTKERVDLRLSRIAGSSIAMEVVSESRTSNISDSKVKVFSKEEFQKIVQERIIGQNDLMGVAYLEYAINASKTVGRIIIRNGQKRVIGYGTGFLVSPQLILTNNHVLPNSYDAKSSLIEFNYQSGIFGQSLQSYSYNLDPEKFFLTDPNLDFSLVALVNSNSDRPSISDFGWNRLIEEQGKVIIGEYINIIQHPQGEPKQLALRENRLVDILDDFLHYQTDTAPGSSGSPVFNDQWEVVGLHHSGVPLVNKDGQFLTKDNKIWNSNMGEDQIVWKANEGCRTSSLVKHIKQQRLSSIQKQIRAEMFDAQPPRPEKNTIIPVTKNYSSQSVSEEGTINLTIPLNISLSLGQLTNFSDVNTQYKSPSLASDSIPETPTPIISFDDPEILADLELLERTRRKEIPYYDRDSDIISKSAYYNSLIGDMERLSSKDLFNRLSRLITETHKQKLSYSPSKHVYPWVDVRPDLKIRSVYSEIEYEPEQIIREDLRIDQERLIRTRELMTLESELSLDQITKELDLLEAQLPYNCEHVVPQSWFGKKEPMRGDLHHLFACESDCNSFRGNTPYFEFTDFNETIRNDCGKSERKNFKFEPGHGKGSVARATLYFLLRYPGQINNIESEFKSERIEILLEWHKGEPVTEYELHRNMAIYKKQGNRNPLIDFPDWAEKINFSLGLG